MDDYSALAYRIAGGVADVRGCLILSRDGLILGSYPDDETVVKPAWVRFASLGDPERSFVEFGDQVWVYVRRPAYGAFAVANAGVRPGLVIDQLEGILASAEEARSRRDTLRVPEASPGPPGGQPTSLRPSKNGGSSETSPAPDGAGSRHWARTVPPAQEKARVASAVGRSGDAAAGPGSADAARATADDDTAGGSADRADEAPSSDAGADGAAAQDAADTHEPNRDKQPDQMELDADAEVDPVMLAKEFSGLLQVESGDDEASS